ncbi:hypothetical protein KQX54_002374 [Cotesia glomerata]|uniref:Uncharacterized protein n=1 Tax=Cotesia glomerata TaxID=32391 RepID=A0AAV7I6B0_COTGL|nr:hypothetical protein KQX54_002374 [Cotesia glomerata]
MSTNMKSCSQPGGRFLQPSKLHLYIDLAEPIATRESENLVSQAAAGRRGFLYFARQITPGLCRAAGKADHGMQTRSYVRIISRRGKLL